MIKTNTFVRSLLDKGLVDDVAFLENGYDIQVQGRLTSVRLNGKGGALIYNHKNNDLLEIESGRLDDVLHRYIIRSAFGTQNETGVHGIHCKDTFLVPTKIINNSVIFTDTLKRNFVVSGTTAEAALSFFKDACTVNADDCMIMLNGFTPYSVAARKAVKSSVESDEVELQLLRCSVNVDDYAVTPKSELINNVGQTVVGGFLCSSADKLNYMTFEDDEAKLFMFNSKSRKSVNSSTVRSKNPLASRAQIALNTIEAKKIVNNYLNAKYPEGLSIRAVESALAYEAPSMFKAADIHEPLQYTNVFNHYRKNADTVALRLDSNKSLFIGLSNSTTASKFRAVPDVEAIKNALYRNGYSLTELESGLTFGAKEDVVTSIVNSCTNYVPVVEKVMNKVNTVTKVLGNACKPVLAGYGIDDKNHAFTKIAKVVIN